MFRRIFSFIILSFTILSASYLYAGRCDSLVNTIMEGDKDRAIELIRRGVPARCAERSGRRAPLLAAVITYNSEIALLLIKKGASVNTPDDEGRNLLEIACDCNAGPQGENCPKALPMVRLLLEKGARIDARNRNGETPLFTAVRNNMLPVVKLLLEKGARAGTADHVGLTPLHHAASRGHAAAAKLLLDGGAPVDGRSKSVDPPLHDAALEGHYQVMRILLSRGADPVRRIQCRYTIDGEETTKKLTPIACYARKHDAGKALSLSGEFNIVPDEELRVIAAGMREMRKRQALWLLAAAVYLALAAFLREWVFRGSPNNNILGFFHAFLLALPLCVGTLGMIGMATCGSLISHGGNPFAAMGISFMGILIGGLPGIVLSLYAAYKNCDSFATVRPLYYAPPVIIMIILAAYPTFIR